MLVGRSVATLIAGNFGWYSQFWLDFWNTSLPVPILIHVQAQCCLQEPVKWMFFWMSQLLVLALQGVSIGIQQLTIWDTGQLLPSCVMLSSCFFQSCKLTVNPVVSKLKMDKCLDSESGMWLIPEILAVAGVIQIQNVTLWTVFVQLPIFEGCHAVMICSATGSTQHLILWDPSGDPFFLDGCKFLLNCFLWHLFVTGFQVMQFYHGLLKFENTLNNCYSSPDVRHNYITIATHSSLFDEMLPTSDTRVCVQKISDGMGAQNLVMLNPYLLYGSKSLGALVALNRAYITHVKANQEFFMIINFSRLSFSLIQFYHQVVDDP
jgi:hypothetical protein